MAISRVIAGAINVIAPVIVVIAPVIVVIALVIVVIAPAILVIAPAITVTKGVRALRDRQSQTGPGCRAHQRSDSSVLFRCRF